MLAFYKTFDEVKDKRFDGMVITGAPVEQMPFEEVEYWDELCEIMEWTKTHVTSTFHICWGAQAGLYYHFGIGKYPLKEKMFGVFPHVVERRNSMLFRGADDIFMVPHSRHTEVKREDIEKVPELGYNKICTTLFAFVTVLAVFPYTLTKRSFYYVFFQQRYWH